MAAPEVVIYTKFGCGYCFRAKRLLDEKGVAYTEHDITMGGPEARRNDRRERPWREPCRRFSSARHTSAVRDDLHALEASGKLDELLPDRMTRIALLQMTAGIDPAANARTIVDAIAEAAQGGAAMLFTPEMSGLLDRDRTARGAAYRRRRATTRCWPRPATAATRDGLWIALGSLAVAARDGRWANRSLLIDAAGEIAARYDKIHMFDVDLASGESWRESNAYAPGREVVDRRRHAGRTAWPDGLL